MSDVQNNPQNEEYEDEIDFLAIFKRLLQKKVFIAKVMVMVAIIGLFFAVTSPKTYKSECIFFPQTSSSQSGSNLSSLAALAGINMGGIGSSQLAISPNLYPTLLENDRYIRDLMYSEVYFPKEKERYSIFDYYTDSTRMKPNVVGTVLKYTVGLPGVIVHAIRGDEKKELPLEFLDTSILVLSKKERQCAMMLKKKVLSMELDQKKGYISLSSEMEDPFLAAQMTQMAYELLQEYVVLYRTQKAQFQFEYIDKLVSDAKMEYDSLLEVYSKYQDSHRFVTSKEAGIESVRLKNQYELANGVLKELSSQREQAKVRVREDIPILTIVKPVSVPSKPSNMGKSKVLMISLFLGVILASGLVLLFDFLKNSGMSYPAGWHNQEEDDEAERKILESGLVPDSFWKKFFSRKLFV